MSNKKYYESKISQNWQSSQVSCNYSQSKITYKTDPYIKSYYQTKKRQKQLHQTQNFLTSPFKKSQNNIDRSKSKIINQSNRKNISNNSLCQSTINTTNINFCIQSQPNQMHLNFSKYFENSCDIIQQAKPLPNLSAASKITQLVQKLNIQKYLIKRGFYNLVEFSSLQKQKLQKSLLSRQQIFIDIVEKSLDLKNPKFYTHTNISFHNKMIGIIRPQLICLQKQRLIQENILKIQNITADISPKSNKSQFNFTIYNDRSSAYSKSQKNK